MSLRIRPGTYRKQGDFTITADPDEILHLGLHVAITKIATTRVATRNRWSAHPFAQAPELSTPDPTLDNASGVNSPDAPQQLSLFRRAPFEIWSADKSRKTRVAAGTPDAPHRARVRFRVPGADRVDRDPSLSCGDFQRRSLQLR
jgi:hypothetical protein